MKLLFSILIFASNAMAFEKPISVEGNLKILKAGCDARAARFERFKRVGKRPF